MASHMDRAEPCPMGGFASFPDIGMAMIPQPLGRLSPLVLASLVAVSAAAEGTEDPLGFVSIFDGESFAGWEHDGNWRIEDGAFHRHADGGSLTYTAATVPDDFELRFEWKASRGCNSGVYYRPGQVEYQVLDDEYSPYGANPRQSAASLFFCMAPGRDATRPHGQWNTGRVICQGTVIEHWLNGERVLSFDYSDPKWKAEIDLLAVRGGDLTGRGGQLWLQDHGQDVWFRDLRWREIPASETVEPDPEFRPLEVTGEALAQEQARVRRMLAARRQAAPRPNFVVVMADDLGWGDVGCYGPSPIPTPHIDRLARQGIRFTDAHSPAAICSPTRYSLLTGTDPYRRYHTSHVLFNGEPLMIAEDQATVASMLSTAGYRTGVVGKWHVGLGDHLPRDLANPGRGANELGFDTSFLVADGHNMLPHVYLADGRPVDGRGDPIEARFPSRLTVIDRLGYKLLEHRPAADWPDHRPPDRIGATLVEKAIAFLESAADGDQPFFLYVPTCSIHDPHVPDPRFRGQSPAGSHGDFVMEFDWTVGEIVAALERLGVADETVVIVTSDNGGLASAETRHGHHPSGPWSGAKGSALEGGHRVPFIVRWPGRVAAGVETDALLSLTDLAATFAAWGGGFLSPMEALDSFDQSPVITGKSSSVRESLMVATRGCVELVRREGPHKLTYRPGDGGTRYVHLRENPREQTRAVTGEAAERRDAMSARMRDQFLAGASRPSAIARGRTIETVMAERDRRNDRIRERFGESVGGRSTAP